MCIYIYIYIHIINDIGGRSPGQRPRRSEPRPGARLFIVTITIITTTTTTTTISIVVSIVNNYLSVAGLNTFCTKRGNRVNLKKRPLQCSRFFRPTGRSPPPLSDMDQI